MKNITKKALIMLIATIIFSNAIANADKGRESDDNESVEIEHMSGDRLEEKTHRSEMKDIMREDRISFSEDIKEKKEEMKNNLEEFKKSKKELKNIFSDLTEAQRTELKVLMEEHKDAMETIKDSMEDETLTAEERDALKIEFENEIKSFNEKVKERAGDNAMVNAFIDERLELKEKNHEIRDNIKESRKEFRSERNNLISDYKEIYFEKLASVIPNISDAKLEKLSVKIDSMIVKVEANTKISQERKDKLIAQITSLKELIDEELEIRAMIQEDLNLDDILN